MIISPSTAYRTDIETAVKFFRPLLSSLNIRNKTKQDIVYLAAFDHLDLLNLDNCVVTVLTANLAQAGGLFFCRNEGDYLHCYIVIQDSLYAESMQKVKTVGVHEFCHFMAIIYSITATSIQAQREYLINRLKKNVDDLNMDALNKFYAALCTGDLMEEISELTDTHYRLNCEGETVNYSVLFKHLMFSKELFEEFFSEQDRIEFKNNVLSGKESNIDKAVEIFQKAIDAAERAKDIPHKLAFNQAASWVKEYVV